MGRGSTLDAAWMVSTMPTMVVRPAGIGNARVAHGASRHPFRGRLSGSLRTRSPPWPSIPPHPRWSSIPPAPTRPRSRPPPARMTAELFAAEAPRTVNNFVFLAREGFYDGVIFHRVIKGFMIQGGDPTGTGHRRPRLPLRGRAGDPPIPARHAGDGQRRPEHERQPVLRHARRLRICPPNYTIFGKLTAGEEVVDAIRPWRRRVPQDRPARPSRSCSIAPLGPSRSSRRPEARSDDRLDARG